jgi:hypothetical protein
VIDFSRWFLKESFFDESTGKIPTPPVQRSAALNQGILFRGLPFPLVPPTATEEPPGEEAQKFWSIFPPKQEEQKIVAFPAAS